MIANREILQKIVEIANEQAFAEYGERNTCIATSHALNDALQRLGYNSRLVRVEAHIFPFDRNITGACLGWDGDIGQVRRAKKEKGMWKGHLAVLVDEKWLLDATLDLANNRRLFVKPSAVEVTESFWSHQAPAVLYCIGNCQVRWHLYRHQNGFKNTPAARRIQWGSVKEGTVGGQKAQIVQDDYKLIGIDILPPHTQSDHNAYMMRFESIQPESNIEGKTNTMPESENTTVVETAVVPPEAPAPVVEQETAPVAAPAPKETPPVQAASTVSASVTASTPQNAPVPADVIENLTSTIQAKDALISQQNVKLHELAGKNAVQTAQVETMTETFATLNNEILRLDKAVSELNGAVQDRNKIISERDELLIKRNKTLAERQNLLVKAHETIAQRDVAMAERNQMVMQRNSLISLRDQEIAKRDKELSERNETIAKQDRVIAERDAAIAERDQTIAQERASLSERDAMIAQIDFGLVEKNAEIMALNNQLLAEKVNVEAEKERNKAFQYLFEKVQIEGEKASWFIFNDLRNSATVAEVDEKFAASKDKGIQLIEGVARTAGRAVLNGTTPTDADELPKQDPKKEKPENSKSRPVLEPDLAKRANSIARNSGL